MNFEGILNTIKGWFTKPDLISPEWDGTINGKVTPQDFRYEPTGQPYSSPTPTPTTIPTTTPTPTRTPTRTPTQTPRVLGAQQTQQPSTGSLGRSAKFKQAYTPETEADVNTIRKVANNYGVMPDLLLDIAAQESVLGRQLRTSGYHPTNRSASGLFQFTAPTWEEGVNRFGGQLGLENPYHEQWSPEWLDWVDEGRMNNELNARMAALFVKNGMLGRWDASRDVWGPQYTQEELAPYYK